VIDLQYNEETMKSQLKRFFLALLKDKTALPIIFIIITSLVNYFIITDFTSSPTKLPINLAKASGVFVNETTSIYDKFLKNNFMIPTDGLNWGRLHGNNGVDIANACGNQVYASDEGMVIESVNNNAWNGGYGNFLRISHSNGVITKYSHTRKNLAKVGDYVLQGDPIALIGNTGFVDGITGCHLHFEVEGAENSFAVS